jgi:hypothetical protein
LLAADPVLVAQPDDGVGESGALLGSVDLFVGGPQRVPTPLGIIVFDCFAQALEVGADEPRECDQQRDIDGGEIHELVGQVVQRAVGEAIELVDRLAGEVGEVRAGELLCGGSAMLTAAVLGLAA